MTWKLIFGCYDSFFRRVCFSLFFNEFSNSHTGTFQSVNLPIDIRLLHKCLAINGVCFSLIGFKATCSAVQDLYLIHWCNTDSIQNLSLNVIILPVHTVCFITQTCVRIIGATWLFTMDDPRIYFTASLEILTDFRVIHSLQSCNTEFFRCLKPKFDSMVVWKPVRTVELYVWYGIATHIFINVRILYSLNCFKMYLL